MTTNKGYNSYMDTFVFIFTSFLFFALHGPVSTLIYPHFYWQKRLGLLQNS